MNTPPQPVQKIIKGVVTKIVGNRLIVKSNTAEQFDVQTSETQLLRKNGSAMLYEEISVGDKLEVGGKAWHDGSVNADYVKNLSLYPHNGTFTGKVLTVDGFKKSFTIQNSKYGVQTIGTDNLTSFTTKGGSGVWAELKPGVSVTVKGVWEKVRTTVHAKAITITVRLLNIDFTGDVVLKDPSSLTVRTSSVIYGVILKDAKIVNKKNKTITWQDIPMGSLVRVQGKHLPEAPEVVGVKIKNLSN